MAPQGTLSEVIKANTALSSLPSPVVIIIGGTSGIGLALLKALVLRTAAPRIYFVGRNRTVAQTIIADAAITNPKAKVVFLQYDVYLLENVPKIVQDFVQEELREEGINSEKDIKLNLLANTTGTLNQNNTPTSENLQPELVSRHYSRILSINLLLPYLQHATSTPFGARVFSVLAVGQEEVLNPSINLRDVPNPTLFGHTIYHATALQSLFTEELSMRYPEIGFFHFYPGFVVSGIFRELPWYLNLLSNVITPLLWFLQTSETEVGERLVRFASDEEHKTGAHLINYDGKLRDWRVGGWKQWKTKEEWDKQRADWRWKAWLDFKETVGGIVGEQLREW